MPKREPIDDQELKAIVDAEISAAMGQQSGIGSSEGSSLGNVSGDLANERAEALDYYYGKPIGKLYQPDPDRSAIVMTTVRDTVEWMMPQLMRTFAQPDKVMEFDYYGPEDKEPAGQETEAINHIFWRQNEGFLILYTWFKDALLQKTGTVKFWLDESEDKDRQEYDGLTDIGLNQLMQEEGVEVIEHDPSDVIGMMGQPLHHVVVENNSTRKEIKVMNVPPEEFIISNDARSLDVQTDMPQFVGHRTEKTMSDLREMGFTEADIELMSKAVDDSGDFDTEAISRYNLADEWGGDVGVSYTHESQKTIDFVEGYMRLDKDGDGYNELLRIYRAGDFIDSEPADIVPFAVITPYINPHKHHGLSEFDMVRDIQEILTGIMRNVLDNMYQTNNMRPVVNERVDLDSLLTTRPAAPIYVDGTMAVGDSVSSFSPPSMWKDGIGLLEYFEQVRKDRTGISDETMGLDPKVLANASPNVLIRALDAAHARIDLVARVFAETGLKWLFRGIHELCRKSYDQPLRVELGGEYQEVKPQEWRKRTNLVVNVGTATGSQQRKLAALSAVAEMQSQMIQAGGLGMTLLPSHVYQTAKDTAECMGLKDGDVYFMNPMMRADPQFQEMMQIQMPQQGPDPQTQMLQLNAQVENGKLQAQLQKNQLEAEIKQAELNLKQEELALKSRLEQLQADDKAAIEQAKIDSDERQKEFQGQLDKYKAELQSYTALEQKIMEIEQRISDAANKSQQDAEQSEKKYQDLLKSMGDRIGRLEKRTRASK